MQKIKEEKYKGYRITVYQKDEMKVYVGGSSISTSYFVYINQEDVSDDVLMIGTDVDEWIRKAKQLIDGHISLANQPEV